MNYKIFLFLAFTIFIQADLLAWAQIRCGNSTFGANLNTTLFSLFTNVDNNGFYNASGGQGINRANGMVLCRGDAQLSECRECVQTAAADILNSSCPIETQATRFEDACILRYSNDTIYGAVADRPSTYWWSPGRNATSPEQFQAGTQALLDDLRNQAASGGSLRKVAAANRTGPDFQTIFAMVQCSPDLSPRDCTSCLIRATAEIPLNCQGKKGCRVLWPSCNLRFEIYPFLNETRLQELEPHSPAPVPVAEPPSQSSSGKDDGNNTRIVIAVGVPVAVCLILAVSATIFLRKKKKQKPMEDPEIEAVDEIGAPESVQYSFSAIKAATNDFSEDNKLGQGGFGTVYKGKLPNDEEIAVKRLSKNSGQGDLEFKNEVLLLAKLQHRNLVRLMGFALEGMEKILVYEFVENASLDFFIFDPINNTYLDWERRYKIIAGIARGILYLHEDSRLRIIHRDLKASNILLDKEMNPKIADFGMARLFGQEETTNFTSRIVGTYGYMAPEYLLHGLFSIKSDVFSFGVLVLETISGRKNNSFRTGENMDDLLSHAWKNWRDGTIENVVDPLLMSSSGSMNEMMRCIHIGLLCVQENAEDRPTMASVVLMLSSFSMTLTIPSEPAFYFSNRYGSDVSRLPEYNSRNAEYSHSSKQADKSDHSSQNEASISDLYPR